MKNVAFEVKYLGNLLPDLDDVEGVLSLYADEGILQAEEQKRTKKSVTFIVSYLGDLPPKLSEIKKAVKELDEEGILQVKKTEPIYSICEYCRGTGNEGTMDYIDCGNCGGSGWKKRRTR
jgi:hypothetical protein